MGTMNILKEVRQELKANIDEKYRRDNQKYFKERISCYGVRTPIVRKIAKKYFKQIKHLDKEEIFALSEELFKNQYNEEATVAIQWVGELSKLFEKTDFKIFEVAKTLLHDKEDLVQKGYGWLLKSASVQNQKEVFDFVIKNKKFMSRTALRYAIEKLPEKLKIEARAKE